MPVRSTKRRPLYFSLVLAAIVALWFAMPVGRHLTSEFLGSLRMDKPQRVNVNLSEFVGPNANQSLQGMVTQMVSDQVVTTLNEPPQTAGNAASASQIAGFPVKILKNRADSPEIAIIGAHAYTVKVNRNRLQAIFDEAGRHDLVVPKSIDGATVSIRIPRTAILHYGPCPGRSSVAANVATPPPPTTHYDDCLILREGPSPEISAPSGIDIAQLSQIALELAGMTPDQAHHFVDQVNVRSILGVSFPRFMRSYQSVTVNGVPGTLLTLGGRHGPDYALFWVRDGVVYSLRGFGDTSNATKLAASLT